jgi:peptidoglycan hydrolase-like amidase
MGHSPSRPASLNRRHFIAGLAAVVTLPRLAFAQVSRQTLRFGVFSLFAPQSLLVESAQSLLLHLDRQLVLVSPTAPATLILAASDGGFKIIANRTTYLASSIQLTSAANEATIFTLAVPQPSLHGTIRRQFTGTLDIQQTGTALQPVVSMNIESATASIVQAESPADAPMSYLRAQAIVSRSFLLAAITGHRGFDFCDTTHCQFLRELPLASSSAAIATHETRSQRLVYAGHTLAAMYSSSCGGHTRTLVELGLPVSGYPYYAVACEPCMRNPERWSRAAQLKSGLTERDRLANNRIRGWAALPSGVYTRTADGLVGVGIGHGLGLCQRGAAALAVQGRDHHQLLSHYYPNTVTS